MTQIAFVTGFVSLLIFVFLVRITVFQGARMYVNNGERTAAPIVVLMVYLAMVMIMAYKHIW